MRRVMLLALLLLAAALPALAAEFVLEAEVSVARTDARVVEVWVPLPREDEAQRVLSLEVAAPGPFLVLEDPEFGNRYLYLSLPGGGAEIRYRARVERREICSPRGSPPPSDRFLLPARLVPLEPFRDLARELAGDRRDASARLRAFYDYVVAHLRYDKSGRGWGRGDALFACSAKRGNCTDFHSLLMALARAAGIPVAFEIGLPVPAGGGRVAGYHCWLRAWAGGRVILLDASEAAKHPDKRDYFFGCLDDRRILLTRGRDLLLAPPQHGPRVNFLYRAYAEADLRPAPELVETSYTVSFP